MKRFCLLVLISVALLGVSACNAGIRVPDGGAATATQGATSPAGSPATTNAAQPSSTQAASGATQTKGAEPPTTAGAKGSAPAAAARASTVVTPTTPEGWRKPMPELANPAGHWQVFTTSNWVRSLSFGMGFLWAATAGGLVL